MKQIVKWFSETEECLQAFWMAKLALAVPVTNVWPECGGSAIKTRNRSSMKNYFLNARFMISINGPAFNANAVNTLITQACVEVQDK